MLRGASIIVRHNKVYVPSEVQLETGSFMGAEPVYVMNLNIDELTEALEHVLALDAPIVPEPSLEEFRNRRDPMLVATGTRSWKALARDSLAYGIECTDNGFLIALPELDKQGRFAASTTTSPMMKFPANTSIRVVATAILSDVENRLK